MAPRDVAPGEAGAASPEAAVSVTRRAPRRWGPRDIAPVVVAVVAVVFALHYAADFIVPVVAGVLLAYALEPLVARLAKAHVPRVLGATLLLAAIVAFLGGTAWWLRHDAAAVVADLPQAARKLRVTLQSGEGVKPLAKVREAAAELEKAAAAAAGNTPAKPVPAAPPVQSELSRQITAHGASVLKVAGQLAIAATLALFLLAAGDTFRRKIVRLVGPSLSRRRVTVEILDEIDLQVQRYLLVMLVTNVAIAFFCWGAFAWLGLQRAALWAALTGVLHFIPYVGSVLALVLVGAAALIETGSVATATYALLVTSAIFAVLGMGFNTWLQGRACRMNAVAVFVAVLLFGWLWGGWGLLLGAPLAAVAKTVADRVEALNAFGELLGEAPSRVPPAPT
jgi:predicted PurR-regulated permease PerM